jgi:hypothetical protein
MEICPVRDELFHADGQKGGYDQANDLFFFNSAYACQKASVTAFVYIPGDVLGLMIGAGIAQPVQ